MSGSEETRAPRLRRARREDIPAILEQLGGGTAGRFRNLRRLLKTLVADVYVIDSEGGLAGAIAVNYRRSLGAGGLVATIDWIGVAKGPAAAAAPDEADAPEGSSAACALIEGLIARALRRGCVSIESSLSDPALAPALARAGLVEVATLRARSLRDETT